MENRPLRILYIEDSPLDRTLVREALRKGPSAFELTEATLREEVESFLERESYDLILSDLKNPGFTGLQVLEAVQARSLNTPVIVFTGMGSEEMAVEALKLGAADYIIKSKRTLRYLPHSIQQILEHKQSELARIESERRYRALFEQSNDAIFIINLDGKFVEVNQRAQEMLGYTLEEFFRLQVWEITADPEQNQEMFAHLLQGAEIPIFEGTIQKKDGSPVEVEIDAELVRDQDSNPQHIQALVRDIRERKQAEARLLEYSESLEEMVTERTRELQEAQEQLLKQERMAVLGQIASGIAHELRNPLNVIANAVYYLRSIQPEASAKVQEYLEIIESEEQTAEKTITDLLEFADPAQPDPEAFDIRNMIKTVLERTPPPSNIEFTTDFPADLDQLYADRQQMIQAFTNLVRNAYQAMPQGGRLEISVQAEINEPVPDDRQAGVEDSQATIPWIRITVKDTGEGISALHMQMIFDPLFTTRPRAIGMGLPIAKKLVEVNGGKIEVASQPEKGSQFSLVLPTLKDRK